MILNEKEEFEQTTACYIVKNEIDCPKKYFFATQRNKMFEAIKHEQAHVTNKIK